MDLLQEFEDIGSHGTKIIIFNLWLNDEGIYELNFDENDEDIKLRDEMAHLSKVRQKVAETQAHISYLLHSLRAYASMLYLRKFNSFKIILRGKPIEQFNIADDLRNPQVVIYRPHVSSMKEAVMETTLGFIKEAPAMGANGFNVYHKNCLIRPFWKVLSDGSSKGFGVAGVLEANFIEPAHDKQDFERSSVFSRLETKIKQIQMEYWKRYCHLVGHHKLQKTSAMPIQNQSEACDQSSPMSGSQKGSRSRAVYNNEIPTVQLPTGFQTGSDQECGDSSRDIGEIRDENIPTIHEVRAVYTKGDWVENFGGGFGEPSCRHQKEMS